MLQFSRHSRRALGVSLTVLALLPSRSAVASAGTPFRPAADWERTVVGRLLTPRAEGAAAAGLQFSARCSTTEFRTAVVEMSWLAAEGAGSQQVFLTKFRDGFATGDFATSPPLGADEARALLLRAEPGLNYYWQVVTSTADGWVASSVGRFEVPTCPWDEPEEWQE